MCEVAFGFFACHPMLFTVYVFMVPRVACCFTHTHTHTCTFAYTSTHAHAHAHLWRTSWPVLVLTMAQTKDVAHVAAVPIRIRHF